MDRASRPEQSSNIQFVREGADSALQLAALGTAAIQHRLPQGSLRNRRADVLLLPHRQADVLLILPPCGKWNQRIGSGEVRSVGGQRLGQNGHGRNI